ncbi:MAG TPA: hypothetical protein PKA00_12725 [Saprospiraceae bacterium]|nr:hypothetical protein [Saprospiraceae bacterium]HMQ83772.1 hypothetical protein [Saprospiraceae bacterium]
MIHQLAMSDAEAHFWNLVHRFSSSYPDVELGKMMRSDGLKYQGKVFAFFFRDEMGFRLGAEFDPEAQHILYAKPLSPFKTKPPLKGWYMIDHREMDKWEKLTELALQFTKTLT